MRTTKASFDSAGTYKLSLFLASRDSRIRSLSASRYSFTYFSARVKMTSRFFLLLSAQSQQLMRLRYTIWTEEG
jgi:hypothetical protein